MREKRPSVKGGKGRYVFIRTNHATQRTANRKQRFRTPIKRPLLLDSNILGCVVANQKPFRNRNKLIVTVIYDTDSKLVTSIKIGKMARGGAEGGIKIAVTIKAVSVQKRTITATAIKSGQRTKELGVSQTAEITINGKHAKLGSIKSEQKAVITFDTDLKVVTKIEIDDAETAVPDEESEDTSKVYRLTLHVSEFGDVKFRVERTSEPPRDDFEGVPFTFSNLPHTQVTKKARRNVSLHPRF